MNIFLFIYIFYWLQLFNTLFGNITRWWGGPYKDVRICFKSRPHLWISWCCYLMGFVLIILDYFILRDAGLYLRVTDFESFGGSRPWIGTHLMKLLVCLHSLEIAGGQNESSYRKSWHFVRFSQGDTVMSGENNVEHQSDFGWHCKNTWFGCTNCKFVTRWVVIYRWRFRPPPPHCLTALVLTKVCILHHDTAKVHVHVYPILRSFGSQSLCPPTRCQSEVNLVLQAHEFQRFNAAYVSMTYRGVFVLGEGLAPARQESKFKQL